MTILEQAEAIKVRAEYLENKYGYDKYTAFRIAIQEIIKGEN